MFRANIGVVEGFGFLASEGEDLFNPRGVGDVASDLRIGAGANLFFHLHADGLKIEAHFLEDVDGHALAEFDQA